MKPSARFLLAGALILSLAVVAGISDQAPGSATRTGTGEPAGYLAALNPPELEDAIFGADRTASPEAAGRLPLETIVDEDGGVRDARLAAFDGGAGALPEEGPPEGDTPFILAALEDREGTMELASAKATSSTNGIKLPYLDHGNKASPPDFVVTTPMIVQGGDYYYRFINIVDGGALVFADATTNFWVNSILVENGGIFQVGSASGPIGTSDPANVVTINLYGTQSDTGITCKTEEALASTTTTCGVEQTKWDSDGQTKYQMPGFKEGVKERFYAYTRLPLDDDLLDSTGAVCEKCYFGRKVLAVSYGGILRMFGRKGATYGSPDKPSSSMTSWARLTVTADAGATQIYLDRKVDWQVGDQIVITTTDYLPGHTEAHTINNIETYSPAPGMNRTVIDLEGALAYRHNGEMYSLLERDHPGIDRLDLKRNWVETRAAVGLLTRNVRIVSKGAGIDKDLPDATDSSNERYFGGHTLARQGFRYFQVKGVEFHQMGQGGRMAHNPVNFYMTRRVPPYSYVNDCSIRDSMNRFVSLRGTQNVDIRRNVGYLSIGHGYVLEDGTETHNTLVANLGVTARPAVTYAGNPRGVPGIASAWVDTAGDRLSVAGDYIHPSVFLASNGYNDFVGNMAVGAGTCGACYWFAPATISWPSAGTTWDGYAGIQKITPGAAPIKTFRGNFCSTSPYSLMTIGTTGTCNGVDSEANDPGAFHPVANPFEGHYSGLRLNVANSAFIQPNACDESDTTASCLTDCSKGNTGNCAVSVIDSYTSSFHWAQQNYAAIWLRANWFLVTDSVLTDVQNGGLSMVSGGIYQQVYDQYWGLTRKSVFIGHTQKDNEYALDAGPVSPGGTLKCRSQTATDYCRVVDRKTGADTGEGIAYPLANFSVYQRLYNIYDGPVYADSLAFLDINRRELTDCAGPDEHGWCPEGNWLYSRTPGIIRGKEGDTSGKCVFPNAAVGWKQPNGFYYPPAFHMTNLYFDNVDIRHFVIVPVYKPGTNVPDSDKIQQEYCTYPPVSDADKYAPGKLFSNDFTDVDRQTEINDDDGSLSGLKGATPAQLPADAVSTISVNTDSFFYAPRQVLECLSEKTCMQSPYDFISAVVYPECGTSSSCAETVWSKSCTNRACYGVPIYRQFLNKYWDGSTKQYVSEPKSEAQSIRMMGAETYQRSTMLASKGTYYIDTTRDADYQKKAVDGATVATTNVNVFEPNQTYNFFLLYAKENTKVSFQLYIGTGLDNAAITENVKMVRVGTNRKADGCAVCNDATVLTVPLKFTPGEWPDLWWADYDPESGILSVLMDLGGFQTDFAAGKEESCGPPSTCTMYNGACVDTRPVVVDNCSDITAAYLCDDPCKWDTVDKKCLLSVDSDKCVQHADSDSCAAEKGCGWSDATSSCAPSRDVCKWAVKASECPSGGCFGFQVTFPSTFATDNLVDTHRPDPVTASVRPKKQLNPWWVEWDLADEETAGTGDCFYGDVPDDYIPTME